MNRYLTEYHHQESQPRVEISQTWGVKSVALKHKGSFCLITKGKVKSNVRLGDVRGKAL